MSTTSLYAFLVSIIKHIINADFGGLIGTMKSYEKKFFMACHFMYAFADGLQWRWKEE